MLFKSFQHICHGVSQQWASGIILPLEAPDEDLEVMWLLTNQNSGPPPQHFKVPWFLTTCSIDVCIFL